MRGLAGPHSWSGQFGKENNCVHIRIGNWLVGELVGRLLGWLVGCWVGGLVCGFIGWLVGRWVHW